MNNDFQEFLNKKRDMYKIFCDCGNNYFIFVDLEGGYSVCKKCSKKHYELFCKHCESGMSYVEDSKELNIQNNNWKCVECKKENQGIPTKLYNSYDKDEIPAEVLKENDGRKLLPGWAAKLFFIILIGGYIYFNFILK